MRSIYNTHGSANDIGIKTGPEVVELPVDSPQLPLTCRQEPYHFLC